MKNSDKTILLSICIPTYNRCDVVYENVKKCLDNNYDWIEVVVTDDCSSDATEEKLTSITDKRFRYFRNEKSVGYGNLGKAMASANGEYCLLLADIDTISYADWSSVKRQLENNNNTALFSTTFVNKSGERLNSPPQKACSNEDAKAFEKVFISFRYSGGLVARQDAVMDAYYNTDKESLIYSLYSQQIIALYAFMRGNYDVLHDIVIERGERNQRNTKKTKAWAAGQKEPYWSTNSRVTQSIEWISFIKELGIPSKCKEHLGRYIIYDSLLSGCAYHQLVYDDHKAPVFAEYESFIQSEKAKYRNKWIQLSISNYHKVKAAFDIAFSDYNRIYMHLLMVVPVAKLIKYFIIMRIKGRP